MNRSTNLSLAIAALGCTALVTQAISLREFLAVLNGNELMIGIVLACWMLITAAGSFAARYRNAGIPGGGWFVVVLVLFSLLPMVTIFSIHSLRNVFFLPGEMAGLYESLVFAAIVLFPFCFLSGSLFTFYSRLSGEQYGTAAVAKVYRLEAVGSVAGGLLFGLIAVFFLTTYQSVTVLCYGNLAIAALMAKGIRPRAWQALPIGAILVVSIDVELLDFDRLARERLFPGQEIVAFRDTPYGTLTVTRQGEQNNFFENGVLLFSTNDLVPTEEAVHYAMLQHSHPRRVLLIGGGISGTILEILKYGVERVDYLEINPALLDLGKLYAYSSSDPRVRAIQGDARLFVRQNRDVYDVVLVNVPDPVTAQLNRYYTVEFLDDLRQRLADSAVVQFSLLPASDYLGPEGRSVSSILHETLKSRFREVVIVPGNRNYYIAADRPLSLEVARLANGRGVPTVYVNRYYVDDEVNSARSRTIAQSLDSRAPINRDFVPVAYFRQVLYWVSYFGLTPWVPLAVLLVLVALVVTRFKAVTLGMFTGGFAASALELVILFSFQVVYGYVYQVLAIIIALFMAGLALGVLAVERQWVKPRMRSFVTVQLVLAAYAAGLPFVVFVLRERFELAVLVHTIFALLTLIAAAIVGIEFAIATRILKASPTRVASALYSVDLFGSALGAFVVSVFLLPLIGLFQASLGVALLCVCSALVGHIRRGVYI